MRTFTPGAATKAFYDQLITIANAPAYPAQNAGGNILMRLQPYTLPTPPPDPADPVDLAFLHGICMPLYNAIVAAYAADAAAYATVIPSAFGGGGATTSTPQYDPATLAQANVSAP
jgi:hypothetical protein